MSTPHASSRSRLPKWATSFGNQIIASLILGIVLGALALALGGDAKSNPNWLMVTLDTIGSSYVTLLKAAVVPLIFTAVVASISNLSQVTNAARLAVNTLIWFAITAFFAVLIGIAMGLIVQPGVGAQVQGKAYTGSTGSWTAFLTGLIPVNFLGLGVSAKSGDSGITASASFNVLQILVKLKEKYSELDKEQLHDLNETAIIAGRLVTKRGKGKVGFAHLQDREGQIQIYVRKDAVGEENYEIFKKADLGDFLGVEGGNHAHRHG